MLVLFCFVGACFRCVVLIVLCCANLVFLQLVSAVLWRFHCIVHNYSLVAYYHAHY